MAGRSTHRIVNVAALLVGGVCFSILVGSAVVLARPGLAFSHQAGDGRINFHSTEPLAQDAAVAASAQAWAALQDTPFGVPGHQIDVYVTGGRGWRHQLFFRPATWAGGLTYPVFSQSAVFLRDVDLEAGRLVGSAGPIPDPRDLTYYLVHEITHLRHAEVVGPIAFLRTPNWVREGLPEIAALGLADNDLMVAAMAGEDLPRDTFGSYPLERACMSMVLAVPTIGIEEVMSLRAPMHVAETCPTLPVPNLD